MKKHETFFITFKNEEEHQLMQKFLFGLGLRWVHSGEMIMDYGAESMEVQNKRIFNHCSSLRDDCKIFTINDLAEIKKTLETPIYEVGDWVKVRNDAYSDGKFAGEVTELGANYWLAFDFRALNFINEDSGEVRCLDSEDIERLATNEEIERAKSIKAMTNSVKNAPFLSPDERKIHIGDIVTIWDWSGSAYSDNNESTRGSLSPEAWGKGEFMVVAVGVKDLYKNEFGSFKVNRDLILAPLNNGTRTIKTSSKYVDVVEKGKIMFGGDYICRFITYSLSAFKKDMLKLWIEGIIAKYRNERYFFYDKYNNSARLYADIEEMIDRL